MNHYKRLNGRKARDENPLSSLKTGLLSEGPDGYTRAQERRAIDDSFLLQKGCEPSQPLFEGGGSLEVSLNSAASLRGSDHE